MKLPWFRSIVGLFSDVRVANLSLVKKDHVTGFRARRELHRIGKLALGFRQIILRSFRGRWAPAHIRTLGRQTAIDRKFVMEMLERMEEYEQQNPPEEAEDEEEDSE